MKSEAKVSAEDVRKMRKTEGLKSDQNIASIGFYAPWNAKSDEFQDAFDYHFALKSREFSAEMEKIALQLSKMQPVTELDVKHFRKLC